MINPSRYSTLLMSSNTRSQCEHRTLLLLVYHQNLLQAFLSPTVLLPLVPQSRPTDLRESGDLTLC